MKQNIPTSVRRAVLITLVSTLVFLSFLAGNVTGYLARPVLAADEPTEFGVFWEAWDLVMEHFVDRDMIDTTRMTYGAIEGMLATLGDEGHTTFLSPQAVEMRQSRMEGSFEGIGAYVSMEEGAVTIVAPIAGSPAEAAGILAGDVIVAVDGDPVEGLTLDEVISLIRGPTDSEVTLTVLHPEAVESVDIVVVRQTIELESVQWTLIPGTNLAYLQITQFAATTGEELEEALQEITASKVAGEAVEGLVLDLRNNPGGYLREAVRVNSQFLPEGATILQEADAARNTNVYRAYGAGRAREIPIVVLINEGTASAGEITAGAIKENGRGKLVGQTTFGTGTVLRQFNLSDGSAVWLGISNWLTPGGNLIKGQGVEPDLAVEQTADVTLLNANTLSEITVEEMLESPDAQFLRALEMFDAPMPILESASTEDSAIPLR